MTPTTTAWVASTARSAAAGVLAVVVLGLAAGDDAAAQTYYKGNTAAVLSSTASWWTTESGGTNPASLATTGTFWFGGAGQAASGTWSLGADMSVGQVRLDNITGTPGYSATIATGNTLTLNNATAINLNSGAGGSLTINAGVAAATSQSWVTSRTLAMSGSVAIGGNTITVNTAGVNGVFTISGVVTGTRGAGANAFLLSPTSASGGRFILSNAGNSFTGDIEFTTGLSSILEFTSAAALGANSSAYQVRFRNTAGTTGSGSILRYTGTTNETVGKTIQCDTSIGIRLQSDSVGGSVTFNGGFSQTNRGLYLEGAGSGDNTLASVFAGNGGITKRDAGTWFLNQANTYTGATTLVSGTLKVASVANGGASSALGASGTAAAGLVFAGGALTYTGTGHATNRAFTISASPTINADGTGALTWSGGAPAYTTGNTASTLTLGGTSTAANTWGTPLADNGTGAVALTKAGAGRWVISAANSYSGLTTVGGGTLAFTASNALGSNLSGVAGTVVSFGTNALTIGSVVAGDSAATFGGRLDGTGAVLLRGGSSSVVVAATGASGTSGNGFSLAVTTANLPTGPFALDTGASVASRKDFAYTNNSGDVLTLSSLTGFGSLRSDSGGSDTMRFITVDQAGDTTFNGAVASHRSGGGVIRALTLEKTGAGSLTLAGFVGKQTLSSAPGAAPVNLVVNGGLLLVTNPFNTTTTNTDAINTSGTVTITSGTLGFAPESLIGTSGTGVALIAMNGGVLRWHGVNSQDLTVGGRLTLVAGRSAGFDTNGNDVTMASALGGGSVGAAVTKLGGGRLTLAAANSYTGVTTVSGGTLALAGAGRLSGSSALSLSAPGATFDVSAADGDRVVGDLSGVAGTSIVLGGRTLSAGGSGTTTFGGVVGGSGGLRKIGPDGVLALTAVQGFTGRAVVAEGSLALVGGNDLLRNASRIDVLAGAGLVATSAGLAVFDGQTLGGYGTVLGDVSIAPGAVVSPGGSIGTLTISGGVTWSGSSAYRFEITSGSGSPGTAWDLLTATSLSINASAGDPVRIMLTSLTSGTDQAPGAMSPANWDPGASYAPWLFVDTDEAISTFDPGRFAFDFAGFVSGTSGSFGVVRGDTVAGGDASQLYITYAVVPEPGTLLPAAVAAGVLGWFARRRRPAPR